MENVLVAFGADLDVTKEKKEEIVNRIVSMYLDGNEDILKMESKFKMLEDIIKEARKDVRVRTLVIDECEKHTKGIYKDGTVKISLSTRRTADYSEDAKYVELKAQLKAREAYLKGLRDVTPDTETGELIYPPIYKHSEFIKVEY